MLIEKQANQTTPGPEGPGKSWLINHNFTWLSIGQAISNVGDLVYSTTLLIWVFALGGSAAAVSGVLAAQYAPVFILGPLAGVFVDRWHRLHTMLASDLLRALIALLPLLVPQALRLPAIYSSVFLISSISRFFMPARSALTQAIVPEQRQAQAASVGQVTQALAIVIGPALASPLYFLVGPVIALLINAGSFLLSAFCLWQMRVPGADLLPTTFKSGPGSLAQAEKPVSGGINAVFHEMLAGFSFVQKSRVLALVTILGMIAMFGAGAINSLEIVYVSQRLHANTNLYGYLTAAGGLGALVGAVCAGLLASRISSRAMLAGSLTLIGLGISIYALQTQFVLAVIFCFLISAPQGGIEIGLAPMIMIVTPRRFMGRVQSVLNTAMYAASLLTTLLSGFLGTLIPVYLVLLGGGILIAVSGIFGWLALPTKVLPAEEDKVINLEPLPLTTRPLSASE